MNRVSFALFLLLAVTTAAPPAPASAPVGPPGTTGAPGTAPVNAPGGAPAPAPAPNPNSGTAPASVARAVAPGPSPGAPAPAPGAPAAPVLRGVESCKFCCVNAQKGSWTPAPNKKSGCADRPGASARYEGCCNRLGDCCPVSIGLPASLYMCCDSSKKEVCGGTVYQPQCKIDFTVPDSPAAAAAALVGSRATPAPAPGAGPQPPGSAPAAAPAGTLSKCATGANLSSGLPGTCFRRCNIRGRGCYAPINYFQPNYQPSFAAPAYGSFNNFYSGLRQFGNTFQPVGYGMSYGLNTLPSATPYLSQRPLSYSAPFQQQAAPCTAQDACSCDFDCEARGDCCFDYCSFCV